MLTCRRFRNRPSTRAILVTGVRQGDVTPKLQTVDRAHRGGEFDALGIDLAGP